MASVTSLDHDMRKLRMGRYTPSAANEVKSWVEEILGERLDGELMGAIRDGVALCKLVNLALPAPGIRYKASNMPFTQRENISQFLTACERPPLNMPSHDRFLTVDLYDEKDPAQVIQCLGAFSRAANAINPSRFATVIGPKRGAPSPTRKTAEGSSYSTSTPSKPSRGFSNASYGSPSPVAATRSPPVARGMSPSLTGGSAGVRTPDSAVRTGGPVSSWSRKTDEGQTAPAWNIHQYGYMGGASQGNQGVVFGAPRQITSQAPQVPSAAEKQARIRQQELEAEREAQQRREEQEQLAKERQAQIEAEEEQARIEERRKWEEATREAQRREQEDAERQREAMEKEREELRRAREQERQAVERDKEERRKREERRKAEEDQARHEADTVRDRSAHIPSPPSLQGSSENDRIRELERQLAEARQREQQWRQQQESIAQPSSSVSHEQSTTSPDQSFTAGDDDHFDNKPEPAPRQISMRSGGPRPFGAPPKPVVGAKARNTPFTRPSKPLEPARAEVQAAPPMRAIAEPPSDDTAPSTYSSARVPHVTRTDQYLSSNPAPADSKPASHVSEEVGMSSTSERAAEDSRRVASQQKTKAGGWASKSLLEREMERERERQREWEENQMAKARASGANGRGIIGPRAMNSKGS